MLSIGSLYIVKTWDRDTATRDRRHQRDVAAITAAAPLHGVGLVRTVVDHPSR